MGERILNYINTVVFVDKQSSIMGEVSFFREVRKMKFNDISLFLNEKLNFYYAKKLKFEIE